jgi:hypothetical protein
MLIYQHNQHQVDMAQALAQNMGFVWFRAKVSKRALTGKLNYPVGWIMPKKANNKISCHALKEQSVYIDAQGRQAPCCWIGSRQSDWISDIDQVSISWNTSSPNDVCLKTCSVGNDNHTVFDQQWQREVALC